MKTSLHSDLGSAGWHSSLMTTYSVDPSFYDAYIERRLRRYGCENNLLLADAAMLTKAIQATPTAFASAGRRYAILPVSVSGCFHPKIHLRLGSDKARLVVGSANATAAGWCRNLEVVTSLDWRPRDETSPFGPLIRKTFDYLMTWLSVAPAEVIQYKRRLLLRDSSWLLDVEANTSGVELSDGSLIDLFCERGGSDPSILRQFARNAVGEKIRRLVIISPYWDANLGGLRQLRKALSDCPTVIALNPAKNTFPMEALTPKDDVSFVLMKTTKVDPKRFPHAKVLLIETATADHVLFGSTNCSDDALGNWSGRARNAEVSVYRRLKLGTVIRELDLDLRSKLSRSAIKCPIAQIPVSASDEALFNPGYAEMTDRSVYWYPPVGIEGTGAKIRFEKVDLPLALKTGRWRAELNVLPPLGPLIARIILKSGLTSTPFIVHDEAALRQAARGQMDRRLRDAFDGIRNGTEDILDLAQYAHVIFAPDPSRLLSKRGRIAKPGHKKAAVVSIQYDTSEAFRRAVSLDPATGGTGRFSVDDAGLLQLLSSVMRGIAGIGKELDDDTRENNEDQALVEGDVEDDGVLSSEQEDSDAGNRRLSPPMAEHLFSIEQINYRRRKLIAAMDEFQALLMRLANDPSQISNRLAAQTTFMIDLMTYACAFDHKREEGGNARLMVLFPFHSADRDRSFAFRAAQMLKVIWTGENRISQHITIDERFQSLPDDIVAWILLSRWAITRAYLSGRNTSGLIAGQIGSIAREVYAFTATLGPIVHEVEKAAMRKLDERIGVSVAETEELTLYLSTLGNVVTPPAANNGYVLADPRVRPIRGRKH
jgi:hypothetical protein